MVLCLYIIFSGAVSGLLSAGLSIMIMMRKEFIIITYSTEMSDRTFLDHRRHESLGSASEMRRRSVT